jgi:hypothetical protein
MQGGAHRLLAADSAGIIFEEESLCSLGTTFSGNPFGTTNLNSVVFQNNSVYAQSAGSPPFGATQPNSVVIFQSSSLFRLDGAASTQFSGRTYANFEMNHAGTTTATGTAAVSIDNLTVSAGTFNLNMTGDPGHSIKGNIFIANGATLNINPNTNGTVYFNGGSTQSIGGSGTFTQTGGSFIKVNNSNGITLDRNVTLLRHIIFQSGTMTTGAYTLMLGPDSEMQESNGTYVVGTVNTTKSGTGLGLLPSVGVSLSSGTDELGNVTVTRVTGSSGAVTINGKTGINCKWSITSDNPPSSGRTVTFSWVSDVDNSKDLTTAQIWKSTDSGTTWAPTGDSQDASASHSVSVDVTSFSEFTVSDGTNPLPVQLTSFNAHASRSEAILTWSTASETNNYGFEVERRRVLSSGLMFPSLNQPRNSELGTSWSVVGFVQGSGTSTSPREYSFVDAGLSPGRFAYRIKQIDFSGSLTYTVALEAEIGMAPLEFTLAEAYPNPFNPTTTIEFTLPEDGFASLKVYNLLGQEVATLFKGEATAGQIHQHTFDASQLPTGPYISRLNYGGQSLIRKMVLAK